MSTRTVWAMIVTLVALLGVYWLVVSGQQRAARQDEEVRRLLDVPAESITAMTITRAEEPSVRAERTETGWDVVAPMAEIPANQGVWSRMAGQVRELRRERTVAEQADDLTPYGLSAPSLALEIETEEGARHRIVFGALEPTRTRRYALVDGDAVVLVLDRVFREFDRSLNDLRERHLVEVADAGITWMRYVRLRPVDPAATGDAPLLGPEEQAEAEESLAVVVERDAQGLWRLVEPVAAAASQELVEALITEIQYVTARSFIDKPTALADYGLNPPGARISVRSGDGPVETISLGWLASGGDEAGLYVMREGYPSVYVLDGHILTLLPKGPFSFREHRLFTGAATDIAQIRYRHGGEEMVLRNDPEEGWQVGVMANGTPQWLGDVDQTTVSAFIGALKVVSLAVFLEESETSGLDNPRVTMTVEMKDGSTRTLEIGDETVDLAGVSQYFARQDSGAVGKIGGFQAGLLSKTPHDFRDTRLFHFDAAEVTRIDLQVDGATYQLVKEGDTWRLQAPEARSLSDSSSVDALLQRLRDARFLRASSEETDATGLAAPVLEVSVALASGTVEGPVRLGGVAGEDRRYGEAAGVSEVFTVEQELLEGVRDAVLGFAVAGP